MTSSIDGTVRVWDATFQPVLAELAALGAPVDFIEVGEDRLKVEAAGKTRVLDADSGDVIETERGTRPHGRVVGPNGSRRPFAETRSFCAGRRAEGSCSRATATT